MTTPLESFSRELANIFESNQPLTKENLLMFNYIQKSLTDNLLFQTLFMSTAALNKDTFDINTEVHNVVELSCTRAIKKNITISYTRDLGIPISVRGDQAIHKHILQTLLNLFIEKAIENSEISLLVEVSVIFT